MTQLRYAPELLSQTETLFAVANGYLGLRGDFEEATPGRDARRVPERLLRDLADRLRRERLRLREDRPDHRQRHRRARSSGSTWTTSPSSSHEAKLHSFRRSLDWRAGTLDREIVWETPAGKRIAVVSRRMVSMVHRHLALLTYEVRCLDHTAHLMLSSEMLTRHLRRRGRGGRPAQGRRASTVACSTR